MADQKLSSLSAVGTVNGDELVYLVDDPGGTPLDRKVTVDTLLARGLAQFLAPSEGTPFHIHVGASAPASATDGDLWYDTDEDPALDTDLISLAAGGATATTWLRALLDAVYQAFASAFTLDAVAAKAVSSVNFSTYTQSSSAFGGGFRTSSGAQNDEVVFRVPKLLAGTWAITMVFNATGASGIATIATSPDGTTWTDLTTFDAYNSVTTPTRSEVTGLTMPVGVEYLRVKMATKNASSSNYLLRLSALGGLRTGA